MNYLKSIALSVLLISSGAQAEFKSATPPLHAHSIKVKEAALEHEQPTLDVSKDGAVTIEMALPDLAGLSVNEFLTFNLDGKPPVLEVDQDTRVLLIKVSGDSATQLQNVQGMLAHVGGFQPQNLKIVIENPLGIYAYNCSFWDNAFALQSSSLIRVDGLGLNVTGTLSLQAKNLDISGPIFASSVRAVGATMANKNRIFAENSLQMKLEQMLQNAGWMQAVVVTIDTPFLENQRGQKVMIIAFDPAALGKTPALQIIVGKLQNDGSLLSEGKIEIVSQTEINNQYEISSKAEMNLKTNSLHNTGKILSAGPFWLSNPKGEEAEVVENVSGRLQVHGHASILAKQVFNYPAGLKFIDQVLTDLHHRERSINIALPAANGQQEFSFLEKSKQRVFQGKVDAAQMHFHSGLDLYVQRFDNVMSEFRVHGDFNSANKKAEISLHSAELFGHLDLFATDVFDNTIFGSASRDPVGATLTGVFNPFAGMLMLIATISHSATGPSWESPSMRFLQELRPQEIHYVQEGRKINCPFSTFDNGQQKGIHCPKSVEPYYATTLVDGKVKGESESFKSLHWQQFEEGQWVATPSRTSIKVEDVQLADQIVLPVFDDVLAAQYLYRALEHPQPATLEQQMQSVGYLFSTALDRMGTFQGGGLASLIQHYAEVPKEQSWLALSPILEQPFIEKMMFKRLGGYAPSYQELMQTSMHFVQTSNLAFGSAPSEQQIAALTSAVVLPVWTEISQGKQSVKVLAPTVYLPKILVAKASVHKNTFRAEQIDLTVSGDVVIQGLVESTKGNFRLYAKRMAIHGELKSIQDMELYAEDTLLIATLVDEISGQKHGRASLLAKGEMKLTGKQSLESIGAEVKGENIIARSDGDILLLSKKVLSEFKEILREGFTEERRSLFCTEYVSNHWSAGKEIHLEALHHVMVSGIIDAHHFIEIDAKKGDIVTEQIQQICKEEITKKESGPFGWIAKKFQQAVDYAEKTIRTTLQTGADGKIRTNSGGNTNLTAVNVTSGVFNATADGNITIGAGKKKNSNCTQKKDHYLFSFDEEGRFHIYGHVDEAGCEESATYEESILNVGQLNAHAKEHIYFAGVNATAENLASGRWHVVGDKGVHFLSLNETHMSTWRKIAGGFYIDFVAEPGEFSAGAGAHGGYQHEEKQSQKTKDNHFVLPGGMDVKSKYGTIDIEGGTLIGDLNLDAVRISMRPSMGRICISGLDLLVDVGVRAGIKSKLMKAIANAVKIAESDVKVWEDGANLAFKIFSGSVEIANGLIMPLPEGGVWVNGKASVQYSSDCFDYISAPNVISENISLTAEQCVELEAAQITGVNGSIKAKCLHVKAGKRRSDKLAVNASADVNVGLFGFTVPSLSVQAAFQQQSMINHHNAKLIFDRLSLNITDEAVVEGALIQAKELEAEFGSLLIKSLQNEMQSGGAKVSVAVNPLAFQDAAKLFTGGGIGAHSYKRSIVSEMTALLGTNSAKVVVKGLAKVVGAMIANAEKNEDGTYTDKGKLQFQMGQLIHENIKNSYEGMMLGFDVSKGVHKGVHGTVSGDFGLTSQDSETKATIGRGEFDLGDEKINRDVNQANPDLSGIDIEPIHFFFLIPNLSDNGKHFKDYLKSIGRCATGFDCMRANAREILRNMGWLSNKQKPLDKSEKTWRDIFNEQVQFSEEITPEEAQDILDKVEKEFKPLEDEINQKQEKAQSDHNAEEAGDAVLGKVALTRAKVQKAKAYEQEYLMKKAHRPEVREKASQQKKQYEEAAQRSKKEAKESFATDSHFKDEIEKERNRLSGKGDLQGLEYLKSIEELFKDLPQTRNDKALLDAIGDYEFHVSGVKITGQQLLEAVLTGSRAVRGGPGAVTLTMAMKLLHSIVRDNYQDWMRGGGGERPKIVFPEKDGQIKHIFRKDIGHVEDTPENRKLILDTASDPSNYIGTDENENNWYQKQLQSGKQVWVKIRGNRVDNAGINEEPINLVKKLNLKLENFGKDL